jgi:hypothetical protein
MRRAVPAAAALLLVGGLVACGSPDGTTAGAKATSRTSPSPSAVAASTTGPALFTSMTTAMARAKTATVSFTSKISGQQLRGHGAFRFTKTNFAADMSVALPGLGNGRVILLPKAFYLRLADGAGLTTGKPWLEIKTDGRGDNPLATSLGPVLDQLRQAFDPQSDLGMLAAATTVKRAGTEQIDGVRATKYTATVDLAKAAQVAKGALADRYRAMVSSGVKTLDYSLWVGRDNLPRRFVTVVPTAQGDVSASGTYRDWGKALVIKAPPASQIAATPVLPGS